MSSKIRGRTPETKENAHPVDRAKYPRAWQWISEGCPQPKRGRKPKKDGVR
jgi:hypothetical protein